MPYFVCVEDLSDGLWYVFLLTGICLQKLQYVCSEQVPRPAW